MSSFLIEIESVRQGEIPGLILFGMRAALFMDPSMNRADSVALMQIIRPLKSSLPPFRACLSASAAERKWAGGGEW